MAVLYIGYKVSFQDASQTEGYDWEIAREVGNLIGKPGKRPCEFCFSCYYGHGFGFRCGYGSGHGLPFSVTAMVTGMFFGLRLRLL